MPDLFNCALRFFSCEEAQKVWNNNKNWEKEYDGWIEYNVIHLIDPPIPHEWFQQIADEFNVVFKFDAHKSSNKFLEPCIGECESEIIIYKPKDWRPKDPDDDINEWDINPYIYHDY